MQDELSSLLGIQGNAEAPRAKNGRRKRKLSAKAIANIRAGVAKRMGKRAKAPAKEKKPKRTMSAAAKKRLSALAKARWAKVKAAVKKSL